MKEMRIKHNAQRRPCTLMFHCWMNVFAWAECLPEVQPEHSTPGASALWRFRNGAGSRTLPEPYHDDAKKKKTAWNVRQGRLGGTNNSHKWPSSFRAGLTDARGRYSLRTRGAAQLGGIVAEISLQPRGKESVSISRCSSAARCALPHIGKA